MVIININTKVSSDLGAESNNFGKRSRLENIYFGLGHVYNDLCASVWFSYTLFYLQIVMEIPSTTAGLLIMTGQVTDAIATPVAGWTIDRVGTRRAWHATGTLFVTIGFSLIFAVNNNGNNYLSVLVYTSLIILFQIGWALVQISHLSMIPSLARDNNQSNTLTTLRYTASVICGIIVYMTTWAVLKDDANLNNVGPADFYRFRKIMFIITGIGLSAVMLFYVGLRNKWNKLRTYKQLQENEENKDKLPRNFLKSSIIYKVSLLYMASRLYTTLNLIYIPLYLDERQSDELSSIDGIRSTVATVPFVVYVVSFITAIILNFRKQSDTIVYVFGSLFSMSASIWIGIIGRNTSKIEIYTIATLIGIGGSTTLVTSLCLTAKYVKSNGFGGGSVYGIVTFTDKLASGLAVFAIQHLQNSLDENFPNFYSSVLAYVCGITALLGLLSITTLYCCPVSEEGL
ncbi:major facilitator superfamily domain-containing protein 12 isoform X2 [Agrilus planipennis]|uniref:Major facilitator superfamily domain-containing protein 12 isoform X2 n=1 Tax=Agrilus planipennis TaxID=224129 RepID=A0A1W4XFI0_AGRPL|nr:major facilitator superfamily domain-containing protein 12 isoform X2 [Agrilus planipennis]